MTNKKEKLEKPITLCMADIHKLFYERIKASCKRRGLNSTYIKIVMLLHKQGAASQNDIVKYTLYKAPTISLTLQKMEQEGLVERTVDKEDQRIIKVKLTSQGEKLDEQLKNVFNEENENIKQLFNNEEYSLLSEYLIRIGNYLKEE